MSGQPSITGYALQPTLDLPPLTATLGGEPVLCVMGPKACRQAFMRALAGVELAAAGELHLLGEDSRNLDEVRSRALRRRIGYIAPDLRLLSVISGWRNVLLAAHYHAVADEARLAERARTLVGAIDYDADPNALPAHMGQLQHIHLAAARALMLEPEFLFAEDPFRGLETEERQQMAGFLAHTAVRFARRLVVATDDTRFVRHYADRILFVSPRGHAWLDDWSSLEASDSPAVTDYLAVRRQGLARAGSHE